MYNVSIFIVKAHSYSGDICIKAATVPGNVLKNVKELPRIIIELGANNEPSDTVVSCIGIPFLNVISRCAVAVASKSMNATTFQLLDASETTVLNSEYMYFMKKKYLTKKDCNPHALYMCGVLSRKKAESFDISEAKEFLEKAISNGHRSRCTSEKKNDLPIDCNDELIESASLGERSAQATLKKTIKAETLLEWEQTSSTTALLNTGFCYATGIGCIASIEKAEYFLTKAATLGNVIAAHNLVELFKRDLIKNIPEAAHAVLEKHQHSFRRAMLLNLAKLNNSTEVIDLLKKTPINSSNMNYLNYMLGTCAYEGIGCNKNTQEAQQYFLKAANNGHARSQFNLGVLSSKPEEQTEWFTKAMENGCVDAKIALAQLLVTQGEAGKAREAFHLYFDAAKSGHPVAQTAVGAFFAGVYETSVPNKEKLAQIWFRLSAEQGYSLAIGALAICSLKNQKIRQGNELLALLRTQAKHELKSFIDNKETGLKGYLKRELLIQEKDHIFKIVPCMDNLQFNAVVVKQILNNSDTAKEVLIQRKKKEYMLMCTPHWKHVMRAIQYESNTGAIIMEKAQGSLYDFVVSQALSFEMKTKLLLNACEGVLDMHKDGWVHSDLNTFNMLVVDDSVKISDLDTAVNLTNRWLSPPAQIGYTLNFAAPEQLKGIVGFKGDVYNIGITMHHLYTGKGPYENCSPSDISLKIMNGELPEWETSDKYESRMKEIAVLCCSMNPHDRPDVGELICKIKRSEKEISVACKLILFLNLFVVFLLATAIAISAIRPSNCGTDVCSMRSAPNVLALSQDIAAMNNVRFHCIPNM